MAPVNLGVTLDFEETLTITQAPLLRERIVSALTDNDQTIIDCSRAIEADLTVIQLLISAKHTAQALGKPLSLIAPENGILAAAIRRAGISLSELPGAPEPAV